jgi:hypothetical protein
MWIKVSLQTGTNDVATRNHIFHAALGRMRPKFFDHIVVALDTPEQQKLWMEELGVSAPTLDRVVKKAGPFLNDVRAELGLARIYLFPRDDLTLQRHR